MSNRTRIAAAIAAIVAAPALAQNVKVTPLGSQAGEFCPGSGGGAACAACRPAARG